LQHHTSTDNTINSIDPDRCDTGDASCNVYRMLSEVQLLYSLVCAIRTLSSIPETSDPSILCNLRAGHYFIFVSDGCGHSVQQAVNVPLLAGPLTVR